MRTYQGKFKPRNPDKYKGDPSNIVYRSSWELKAMLRFDQDSNVIWWQSEETVIPYRSPMDGKIHRYFVDFTIKTKDKVMLIEVKPKSQTIPPVLKEGKSPKTKRYINEVCTWGVNDAKWKAAREYCKDRNYEFVILTEDNLGIK